MDTIFTILASVTCVINGLSREKEHAGEGGGAALQGGVGGRGIVLFIDSSLLPTDEPLVCNGS